MSEIKINNIPVITENNGSVELTTGTADIGNNALVVDSSGNVGIGTNSPSQTLTIYNGYDNQIKLQNGANANQSYEFGRNGSNGLLTFYGNQNGYTGYVFDGVDGERMRIDSSGYVTTPYQPSFLAYASPSKDSSNYVYNFGIVAHNVGNHYNNSNGIFTAPISGTYLFTASIWAVAGQNGNLLFYVNGNEIVGGHIYANGVASSGYATMIAQIIAGDPVQLRAGYSIQGSQPRNYFSGMLIG